MEKLDYDRHLLLHFHFNIFFQIQTAAKTAGVNPNVWVENADRWVAGFLEMFEERCHKMVSGTVMDLDTYSSF